MAEEKSICDVGARHPFNATDLVNMQRVGAPVVSPDSKHVVFTVKQLDPQTNKSTTSIWLTSADDLDDARRLHFVEFKSDSELVWLVVITHRSFLSLFKSCHMP
jgi:dipeptidyl aminopeptidase/acylaminoacyl peptidase